MYLFSSSPVSVLSEGTSCNTYGLLIVALQQQVSFIFFFFFFVFFFFALKFSPIGIELMKNMHFTTLGLGTELGIIIACIGGKRPWLGSSYLLFN